MTSHLIVMT